MVPLKENPHLGYRGNIRGEWGHTTHYGIYPEPLHASLGMGASPRRRSMHMAMPMYSGMSLQPGGR
jgi:hypothetical protein